MWVPVKVSKWTYVAYNVSILTMDLAFFSKNILSKLDSFKRITTCYFPILNQFSNNSLKPSQSSIF